MEAWIEIVSPDGRVERQSLQGDRLTLGSSPAAAITLEDAEQLWPDHLLLAPRRSGCWIAVAAGAPLLPQINGRPHLQGLVSWGSEIALGQHLLRLSNTAPVASSSEKRSRSPVMLAALLVAPLSLWLFMSSPDTAPAMTAQVDAPQLFAEPEPCGVAADQRLHQAREAAQGASHKSERYPFHPQDGVDAVRLWGIAHSCYAAAGRDRDAGRVLAERDRVARRIEGEYRNRRVRLERALERGLIENALFEAHALNGLLAHRRNEPYATWLLQVERQLRITVDQQAGEEQ